MTLEDIVKKGAEEIIAINKRIEEMRSIQAEIEQLKEKLKKLNEENAPFEFNQAEWITDIKKLIDEEVKKKS